MKKLLNKPVDCVNEMLEGVCLMRSDVNVIPEHKIVIRSDIEEVKKRQVVLVSGGGSGHEPAHVGYIGQGCLGAVVCGEIFSSPTQSAVYAAIRACGGPHGVLLIVKNYTGDKINFKLAAEKARIEDNIQVETVIIADDVALLSEGDNPARAAAVGARGLAGVVLLHKYIGALASTGMGLSELASKAREFSNGIRTMGVALTSCVIPSLGKATFEINAGEMEVGLGIHGEHGLSKQDLKPADEIVKQLLTQILRFSSVGKDASQCVVMINNLGSTTVMEMSIVARAVLKYLKSILPHVTVERCYVGQYLTAMEMCGISISVCPVNQFALTQLDKPTSAPAWIPVTLRPRTQLDMVTMQPQTSSESLEMTLGAKEDLTSVYKVFHSVCDAFIANSELLTALDAAVGDGDLGSNLESASRKLLEEFEANKPTNLFEFLSRLGYGLQQHLGGTSGPMYSIFFLRMATHVAQNLSDDTKWIDAFRKGIEGIEYLGDAAEGDRTMLDALWPAWRAMNEAQKEDKSLQNIMEVASNAANEAVERTKGMIAKRGRSSYLRERVLGHVDPGAKAVAIALESISNMMN